jgi:RNA polymerase sigma-70 factor (ECF subfamily)
MNGSPATAEHPDLAALAAGDLREDAFAPIPQRRMTRTFQPELVACATVANLKELTKAICRGDETAFTQFYDLYSLRLYKHLLVLAKGNEGEAREVLQTVVVKLARGFKVFDEERRLWGWLCRSARNSYVDLCRARRRDERFVPLEAIKPEQVESRDGEHRLSASLHHALEQLTAEEQELMRAAYVDERSLQELASASGRTYKAVESRLARLRQKLKTNLLTHLRHED